MPSTIPYDPSLVLANIVSYEALGVVKAISAAQGPVDAAQEDLNALLASRRSLDMTKTELLNLGISTDPLNDALKNMNDSIATSAAKYASEKVKAEGTISGLRSQIQSVHSSAESPVDYVKTEIKTLPLASDSLNMDVQYFSRDSNKQEAASYATSVSNFVSASTSWMGIEASSQMSSAAQKQVSAQVEKHQIEGTLVLSVSCTHKNATVLAPFVLNVDKAIKVWNGMFSDDQIDITNPSDMNNLAQQVAKPDDKKFSIISGMTFGSSFVGMVHILNTTDTSVSESISSFATSLQAQMDAGAWFEDTAGGFGVNSSIGSDVKNLLSSQNITSHVTLISMGVIPSMAASDLEMGVKQFAQFDPESSMKAIATLQNATAADQSSVKDSADRARTGQKMLSMRANDIKSALSALSDTQKSSNKVLDINSMMNALDDYLKKAAAGNSGVPLNYYLKDITKDMLAEMWTAKYFPGKYMAIKWDDGNGGGAAGGSGGGDAGGA